MRIMPAPSRAWRVATRTWPARGSWMILAPRRAGTRCISRSSRPAPRQVEHRRRQRERRQRVRMSRLLSVLDLTKVFSLSPGSDLVAVRAASLTLDRRETLGLVGESGSGKTTLGRCILRLMEPTHGRILLDGNDITDVKGRPLRDLRARMQLVFQDPFASLNPRFTVEQTVGEPLMLHGVERATRKRRTVEM